MERNILKSTYFLTLTSVFCSLLFVGAAQAQRTSGPDTSGPIVEVVSEGRILTEDLYRIEGQCLFNLVNIIYSRGPIKPGIGLKPDLSRFNDQTRYNQNFNQDKYSYFTTGILQVNKYEKYSCHVDVRSSLTFVGPDPLKDVIHHNEVRMEFNITKACVEDADVQTFTVVLPGVPFFRYTATQKMARNKFGVIVYTDKYYADQISVDPDYATALRQRLNDSEIIGSANGEVFFRYPKSEYVACLQAGLNQLGLKNR